ncbi:nucleolar protein 14-like [Neltuma alba]|uniref:nucleolar protein 14-like n=1 Tax=Neltuma alba TaxID=207710 RepID=UPI0010A3B8F7|nr:nucleolar protein 14-like [Prosopis alba]
MKVKAPKENPFETIWSRRKFDIVGKKRKGEERRVGMARSRGIEKRNKTLLKEYEQRGKSSVFVDKRIGEKNEDLDEFGKAVLRSQREFQLRSKLNKKSKYNLSDGEEDDDEGLEIPERDDFEDEMVSDDDDAVETGETENNSSVVDINNNTRISGEEGEPNKHKSKKEVMDEIISKSKFFKAQKAKEKEENEQLLEDLDQKFTALIQSKALLSLTEPRKMNSLGALVNKSITIEPSNKDSLSGTQKIDTPMEEKPDAYDKLVKELALEIRARPSDRTKTPEEIAQEERERLERLEEERQKRMTAAEDSSDEDDRNSENPQEDKPKLLSGDDLGDSFSVNEETVRKKGWIDEILERENAADSASEDGDASDDSESSEDADEGSDEDPDEDENNLSLKDWEQSDDEDIEPNLEDEREEDSDDDEEKEKEAEQHDRVKAEKKMDTTLLIKARTKDNVQSVKKDRDYSDSKMDLGAKKSSAKSDIPYIIEAPKTFEELCSLLDNCSNSDIVMVINRIRASNAIKLAAENRKKMQVFYGNLLQYFAVMANKKPLNFELLNLMGKPLIEMSMEIPFFATICARQRIERARKQLVQSLKNPESSSWPSSKMLFLLRLWSLIFPCTDFRHPVMTLAILLMCEYLMRCPILSGRDVAIGAFLCSMLLSIFKQSRKFCPEAIIFLRTMLVMATEKKSFSDEDSQFYQLVELKAPKHLLCMQEAINEISPLNFIKMIDTPEDSSFFSSDDFRASALVAVLETLRGFVNIYDSLSSFPEIFLPVLTSLSQVEKEKNIPNALRDTIKDVDELIKSKVDEHHATRRPLQMRKKKPEPIKLLNPKFEENFVMGRDYDPDRERAQRRKLYKEWKRESKRAASELRKDSTFLYDVRDKEKALLNEERAEKYGRAKAFLQEQEHAFKSGQLGKGRKRRR